MLPAALVLLGAAAAVEAQSVLHGRILNSDTGAPIAGAVIQARAGDLSGTSEPSPTQTRSDSAGTFDLDLGTGQWRLRVQCIGYRHIDQQINVDSRGMPESVVLRLEPQPLLLDEMVVRMRRSSEGEERSAGIEVIKVADEQSSGADLPGVLDRALGLQVRRYGGLGSSASVSIRGSTSEQVLVYLDGVPLNQASGGVVDIGYLPLAGVEEIEVYRGAVPIRFGGNSIGGVVHMRTAAPEGQQLRLYANGGSFATRIAGGSVSSGRGPWKFSGLADYRAAENDFRFLDDNGTEYNLTDDEWVRRENSDFLSFRGMAKAWRPIGSGRVRLHNIVDVSHHGIPGIGNYQSKHTRYDTWRNLTEAELSGTAQEGSSAYRLTGYHAVEVGEYQDPLGEVGVGSAHDRNTTRSFGLKVEGHTVLPRQVLLTGFSALRRETFATDDLLRTDDPFEDSRRHTASLATEVEIPAHGDRVLLNAGTHVELLSNRLATTDEDLTSDGHNDDSMRLWGYHAGGRWQLSRRFSLRINAGLYQRPPSFFELFGDRGGVIGNGDLASEEGWNWDSGLIYEAGPTVSKGIVFAEAVWYQNRVDNMIRFVQNSQFVSQPHNFGSARLSGLETRARLRLPPTIVINGNYTYQRAENRSPFSYERGNDLPNAPRHALSTRIVASSQRGEAHYEIGRDSRHYLDRANLRPVPARTLHGVGIRINMPASASLALEVRNVTDNQIADLWGFPLPGRSLFASIQMSATGWPTRASSHRTAVPTSGGHP